MHRQLHLTRRALLGTSAAAGAAFVAGCTPSPAPSPTGSGDSGPDADADAAVRADVAAQESDLIALYDAVLVAYPNLSGDLSSIREEHRAHAEAMGVTPNPSLAPSDVGSQPQALAALQDAEQQAVAQRTSACEATASRDLARVIALIAASEAGHTEFLRRLT